MLKLPIQWIRTKWDSNFLTLNFRCFVSWTLRKLTNAWVINSVIHICIYQVSITVFKDFFQTFQYQWSFSRLFKALKISTLHSRTFHTFPGSVQTLKKLLHPDPNDFQNLITSSLLTDTSVVEFSRRFLYYITSFVYR